MFASLILPRPTRDAMKSHWLFRLPIIAHGLFLLCAVSSTCNCERDNCNFVKEQLYLSEVGGENRRFPDRESKPSTQHPHRTHRAHDTTDQWREISGGGAELRRFGLLLLLLSVFDFPRPELWGVFL